MEFAASQGGPKVPSDAMVAATAGIGPREEGGFGLTIALSTAVPGLPMTRPTQTVFVWAIKNKVLNFLRLLKLCDNSCL